MRRLRLSLLIALALVVSTFSIVDASRGNLYSTKAIQALSSLIDASGNLVGITTTTAAGVTTATFSAGDGTVNAPSYGFASDADGTGTGIYRQGTNIIGETVNGVAQNITNSIGFQPATNTTAAVQGQNLGRDISQWSAVYVARSIQGSVTKTLTESAATGYVTLTVANSEVCAFRVPYTIIARDATNTQAVTGEVFGSCAANSTGTVTCAVVSDQHVLNPVTSGTLTNTTTETTAANATTLLANATSSLTQTLLEIRYRVETLGGTCTVTPL